MQEQHPLHLFLHIDRIKPVYTLQGDPGDWRREFLTMTAALIYASSIVVRDTPLVVFDEAGTAVSSRTVYPRL